MKKIDKIQPDSFQSGFTNLVFLEKFCEGDKDLMQKYIKIFIDTTPRFIEKLNTELAQNDYKAIAIQIHGFKTKMIMMGMKETKDLAFRIEKDCREGLDLTNLEIKISILVEHIKQAIIELETFHEE